MKNDSCSVKSISLLLRWNFGRITNIDLWKCSSWHKRTFSEDEYCRSSREQKPRTLSKIRCSAVLIFTTNVIFSCCIRCQTVSERRGSNFGAIHRPNVDQTGKPVFVYIAVRKSAILKLNLKNGGDHHFLLWKFFHLTWSGERLKKFRCLCSNNQTSVLRDANVNRLVWTF